MPPTEEEIAELLRLLNGRVLESLPRGSKPTFKRWYRADGEPMGYEFRPFGVADYGYAEDKLVYLSWSLWALQTVATMRLNWKEASLLLAGAMLYNDFGHSEVTMGASLVHNVQAGFLVERYISQKSARTTLTTAAIMAELAGDLWCIYDERQRGMGFNTYYSHKIHAMSLVAGAAASWAFRKLKI